MTYDVGSRQEQRLHSRKKGKRQVTNSEIKEIINASDDEAIQNREHWLTEMARRLNTLFTEQGYHLPKYRVSCGFPSSRGFSAKYRTEGECHYSEFSKDGTCEVFINPCIDEPLEVAAILVHELIHVALGSGEGHRKMFRRLALALGLEGQMRSTVAGQKLRSCLEGIINEVGPYPHACITGRNRYKQSTRLKKVYCPNPCHGNDEYIVRMSRAQINYGLPTCPCGTQMIVAAE